MPNSKQATLQNRSEEIPKWKLEKQKRDQVKAKAEAEQAALNAERIKEADKLRLFIIAAKTEAADCGIEFDEGAFVEKVKAGWDLARASKDSGHSYSQSITRQKKRLTDVPESIKDQYLLYICAAKAKADENGIEFDEANCTEHFMNAVYKKKDFMAQEELPIESLTLKDIDLPFQESMNFEPEDDYFYSENEIAESTSASPESEQLNSSPQSVVGIELAQPQEDNPKEQIRLMIQTAKIQAEAAGVPFSESQFVLQLVLKKKQDFLELKKAVRDVTQFAGAIDVPDTVTDLSACAVDTVDETGKPSESDAPLEDVSCGQVRPEVPEVTPGVSTPDRSRLARRNVSEQIKLPPSQEKILQDKMRLAVLAARATAEEAGRDFDEEAFKAEYLSMKANAVVPVPKVEERVTKPRTEHSDHTLKELAAAATLSILPTGIREKDRDRLAAAIFKTRFEEAGEREKIGELISKIEVEREKKERAERRAAKDAMYKSNVGAKSADPEVLARKTRAERRAAMESQFRSKLSEDLAQLQEKQLRFQEKAVVPSRNPLTQTLAKVECHDSRNEATNGDFSREVSQKPVADVDNACPPELDKPAPNTPQSPEPAVTKKSVADKRLQDQRRLAAIADRKKEEEARTDSWNEEAFIKCYIEAVRATENGATAEASDLPEVSAPTATDTSFKTGYLEAIKAKKTIPDSKAVAAKPSSVRADVMTTVAAKTLGLPASCIREKDRERLTALMLKSRLDEEGSDTSEKYDEMLSKAEEAAAQESALARRNSFKEASVSRFAASSNSAAKPALTKKQKQLSALNDIYKLAVVAERNIAKETGQLWDEEAFKKCFLMAAQRQKLSLSK